MEKESDILKIVKEDILEVVGRKNKRIPLKFMKLEVTVSHSFVSKAIKELEEEGLVKVFSEKRPEREYIQLTKEGQARANVIIEKHSVLEKYFRKRKSKDEAIKATNIIEHYISTEALNNIKKLSTFKGKSRSLTEFELKRENLITDIEFSVDELFERLVSMGIVPGEKIRIMYKISDGFVVNVSRKKIALGKDIAKKIKVLK